MAIRNQITGNAIRAEIMALEKGKGLSSDLNAFVRVLQHALDTDPEVFAPELQLELFEAMADRIAHFGVSCAEHHSQLSPFLMRYAEGADDDLKRRWLSKYIAVKTEAARKTKQSA